jgi:hypothetical protein
LNVCNENFEIHSFVFFFVKMLSRYLPATQWVESKSRPDMVIGRTTEGP